MPSGKKRTNRQSYRNDYSRAGRSPAAAAALGAFLVANLPTLALAAIQLCYRGKRDLEKRLEQMKLRDL